jgi:hypothetical protein
MDLITALQAATTQSTTDGFTVTELIAQVGLSLNDNSRRKVRKFLQGEIAAGRVTSKIGLRPSITGHAVATPVYVPVETKKK